MIRKKLLSRHGLTLAETLTALAIFAILSVALVIGTTAAWKVYEKAVVASEARTLRSTLTQALANELRYARNIRIVDGTVTFDSETFGDNVSVNSGSGKVQIVKGEKEYYLLPKKAYTKGLGATAGIEYNNGIFTVTLTITHPLFSSGKVTTITIQALNATTP